MSTYAERKLGPNDVIVTTTTRAANLLSKAEVDGRDPTGLEWAKLVEYEHILIKELDDPKFKKAVNTVTNPAAIAAHRLALDTRSQIAALKVQNKSCGTPTVTYESDIHVGNPNYINAAEGKQLDDAIDKMIANSKLDEPRVLLVCGHPYVLYGQDTQPVVPAVIESSNAVLTNKYQALGQGQQPMYVIGLMLDHTKQTLVQALHCAQEQAVAKGANSITILYGNLDTLAVKGWLGEAVSQFATKNMDHHYSQVRVLLTCAQPWAKYGDSTVIDMVKPLNPIRVLMQLPDAPRRRFMLEKYATDLNDQIESSVLDDLVKKTGPSSYGGCLLDQVGLDAKDLGRIRVDRNSMKHETAMTAFGCYENQIKMVVIASDRFMHLRIVRESMNCGECWEEQYATQEQKNLHKMRIADLMTEYKERAAKIKTNKLLPNQRKAQLELLDINLIRTINLSGDKEGRRQLLANLPQEVTDALVQISVMSVDIEKRVKNPFTGERPRLKLSSDVEKDSKKCNLNSAAIREINQDDVKQALTLLQEVIDGHARPFIVEYLNHILVAADRTAMMRSDMDFTTCVITKDNDENWLGRAGTS